MPQAAPRSPRNLTKGRPRRALGLPDQKPKDASAAVWTRLASTNPTISWFDPFFRFSIVARKTTAKISKRH